MKHLYYSKKEKRKGLINTKFRIVLSMEKEGRRIHVYLIYLLTYVSYMSAINLIFNSFNL